jgi:predicted acyltransferase
VFGRNPLFIYLLSEITAILLYFFKANPTTSCYTWLFENIYQPMGNYIGSLFFALSIMLFCWLVGYVLDKKKIYIKV